MAAITRTVAVTRVEQTNMGAVSIEATTGMVHRPLEVTWVVALDDAPRVGDAFQVTITPTGDG
jgi:hypothetical protein